MAFLHCILTDIPICVLFYQGYNCTLTGTYETVRKFTAALRVSSSLLYSTHPNITHNVNLHTFFLSHQPFVGILLRDLRTYRLQVCGQSAGEPDAQGPEGVAGD